jgi:RNA polymerase primary sigma factor
MTRSKGTEENLINIYWKDINKFPLLTAEEEEELGKRMCEGDESARKKMIESNLRFVVGVAKKYLGSEISFEDLIGEGNCGLIEATEKYDHSRGCKFRTYALWWVRKSITKAIADKTREIRIPTNRQAILSQIKKMETEGKSLEEISGILKEPISKLNEILDDDFLLGTVSLNQPIRNERGEKPNTLEDCFSDSRYSPEKEVIEEAEREYINDFVSRFVKKKRDAEIIKARYGFNGAKEQTRKEIAEKYGFGPENVRQIEKRRIKELGEKRPDYELR